MNADRQNRMNNRSGSPSRHEKMAAKHDSSNRVSKSSRSRRRANKGSGPNHSNNNNNKNNNKVAASYVSSEEQARRFVADEDNFVLRQSKKKAGIRVRERRAKPIDFLAFGLRYVEGEEGEEEDEQGRRRRRDVFDEDEEGDDDIDVPEPAVVVQAVRDLTQLAQLEEEIGSYQVLERDARAREYWEALRSLCEAQRARLDPRGRDRRVAVEEDIERILAPKTYEQLGALERQIRAKLRAAAGGDGGDGGDGGGEGDVDTDYWEQLLQSLRVWKARAVLARTVEKMMRRRAERRSRFAAGQGGGHFAAPMMGRRNWWARNAAFSAASKGAPVTGAAPTLTAPAPTLASALNPTLASASVAASASASEPTPAPAPASTLESASAPVSTSNPAAASASASEAHGQSDLSSVTQTLYDREAARGVKENEEVFAAEEELPAAVMTTTAAAAATTSRWPKWVGKHRMRKPRYFNRVQMGYEWNKYNQTHYDHENPPPKVVQGYKFNIFYPELVDKTKAPTFKIIREHGRRRGESFAAAGEEDTCLIRFIAGPPYTDIAFRIVDREWDYSAKRDRGFRSSFDKGILQLHFQFKRIFYRK